MKHFLILIFILPLISYSSECHLDGVNRDGEVTVETLTAWSGSLDLYVNTPLRSFSNHYKKAEDMNDTILQKMDCVQYQVDSLLDDIDGLLSSNGCYSSKPTDEESCNKISAAAENALDMAYQVGDALVGINGLKLSHENGLAPGDPTFNQVQAAIQYAYLNPVSSMQDTLKETKQKRSGNIFSSCQEKLQSKDVKNRNLAGQIAGTLGTEDCPYDMDNTLPYEDEDIEKILNIGQKAQLMEDAFNESFLISARNIWFDTYKKNGQKAFINNRGEFDYAGAYKMICDVEFTGSNNYAVPKGELARKKVSSHPFCYEKLDDSMKSKMKESFDNFLSYTDPAYIPPDKAQEKKLMDEFNSLVDQYNNFCKIQTNDAKIKKQKFADSGTGGYGNARGRATMHTKAIERHADWTPQNPRLLESAYHQLLTHPLGDLLATEHAQDKLNSVIADPVTTCESMADSILENGHIKPMKSRDLRVMKSQKSKALKEELSDHYDEYVKFHNQNDLNAKEDVFQDFLKARPLTVASLLKKNPDVKNSIYLCGMLGDIATQDRNMHYIQQGVSIGVSIVGTAAAVFTGGASLGLSAATRAAILGVDALAGVAFGANEFVQAYQKQNELNELRNSTLANKYNLEDSLSLLKSLDSEVGAHRIGGIMSLGFAGMSLGGAFSQMKVRPTNMSRYSFNGKGINPENVIANASISSDKARKSAIIERYGINSKEADVIVEAHNKFKCEVFNCLHLYKEKKNFMVDELTKLGMSQADAARLAEDAFRSGFAGGIKETSLVLNDGSKVSGQVYFETDEYYQVGIPIANSGRVNLKTVYKSEVKSVDVKAFAPAPVRSPAQKVSSEVVKRSEATPGMKIMVLRSNGEYSPGVIREISADGDYIVDVPGGYKKVPPYHTRKVIDGTTYAKNASSRLNLLDATESSKLMDSLADPTQKSLIEFNGLTPQKKFRLDDGSEIILSKKFLLDGERDAYLAYINKNGIVSGPRVIYKSNSSGVFRFSDGINIDEMGEVWYSKGVDEGFMSIPPGLQKELLQDNSSAVSISGNVINSIDKRNKDFLYLSKNKNNIPEQVFLSSDGLAPRINGDINYTYRDKAGRHLSINKNNPKDIVLKSESLKPNFSKPIEKFETKYMGGDVEAMLYKSQDGSTTYTIFKDDTGKIWFGDIHQSGDINKFGISKKQYDFGDLTAPRYEYNIQIPPEHRATPITPSTENSYRSNWNYIREIPLVKQWYESQGLALPAKD